MNLFAAIRAVAFDVDGTLYRNNAMYLRSAPFFARHRRLVVAFAAVRREIRSIRPIENLCRLQVEMTAQRLGWSVERASEEIDRHIYGTWQRIATGNTPLPRAIALLEELRNNGFPTVALSDFPVEEKLVGMGIGHLFDHAFSSEETNYLKPNAEPFERVAALVSLPPEKILYVGNSYRYDIEGAAAVGMKTAHVARRPQRGGVADCTFWRYDRLKDEILGRSR